MATEVSKEEPTATTTPVDTSASSPPASVSSGSAETENEKTAGVAKPATTTTFDLDRVGETEGYLLDEAKLKEKLGLSPDVELKKSSKGVVLIPQPTDDPQDPLNWPRWKKIAIMVVIAANACTADYSAATGGSALIPQATEWHISPNTVNHATAGYVLL
jgi:hypothetical protein